jgi:DNA polymerase-1
MATGRTNNKEIHQVTVTKRCTRAESQKLKAMLWYNQNMAKILLIDGNAILHRAYHALPPLTTTNGEPINAVYGFISMLMRLIQDLKPTHIAVAFDTPKPTWRKAEYVGYQANRPALDSDLSPQFQKIYDVLSAMDIPQYALPGYEADDVLGTISMQIKKQDKKSDVIIVTGDKDILQLVDDQVKVYMPIKGLKEAKLFEPKDVIEKMGVDPIKVIDLKAFMGDASDNYPGVTGIGPKTAIGLIEKYGTVEEVYKHLGKLSENVAKKLAEGAEMAVLGKRLATIVRDAPITIDLEKTKKWNLKNKKLVDLFGVYGFNTLTKRVLEVGNQVEKEKQLSLI